MDTSIFIHTIRYKFVMIICLQIFGSVKLGDRTAMGRRDQIFRTRVNYK